MKTSDTPRTDAEFDPTYTEKSLRLCRDLEREVNALRGLNAGNSTCDDVYWSEHWESYFARWTDGHCQPIRDGNEARKLAKEWGIDFMERPENRWRIVTTQEGQELKLESFAPNLELAFERSREHKTVLLNGHSDITEIL